MKRTLKIISYVLFFLFVLFLSLPKENLFYILQKELKNKKIEVYNQKITTNLFSLTLNDFNIRYKSLEVAKIVSSKISVYGLINTITIDNIHLDNSFNKFIPTKIKNIKINYSILNPFNISFLSNGNFGKINASFSLKEFKIYINLKASDLMKLKYKKILNQMKKNKGEYQYEYKL